MRASDIVGCVTVGIIAGIVLISSVMAAVDEGKVSFCYVEAYDQTYALKGAKKFQDRNIGWYKSVDEALDAAQKLQCKLDTAETSKVEK